MAERKILYIIASVCILSGVLCFGTAFYVYRNSSINNDVQNNKAESVYQSENQEQIEEVTENTDDNTVKTENVDNTEDHLQMVIADNTITESTKMVYQYYYKNEGVMEESEEVPPYFLLGFDFNDMLEYYPDWQIVSFSSKEVVMRKIVEEKNEESFIVTQKDGYIAVYYEDKDDGRTLYEITETPISTLTHEEQVRINDGIIVKSEYELAKILAEYNS